MWRVQYFGVDGAYEEHAMYARRASMLVALVLLGCLYGAGMAASDTVNPHDIMQGMRHAYNGIQDYTALFLKRERINGTLQELETIEFRFQEPFKLYMAWQEPHKGRALTYIEGENNNKMLVKPGGLLQFVHLSLDPDSPLATRNAHHTVRQAGLRHTIDLLMREYQRGMQQGQMQIAFRGYAEVDERPTYHIEFVGPKDKKAGYYAYRGEIWIDQEHFLPTKLHIYDWDNQLYEDYEYRQLRLNPDLGPEAFVLTTPPPAVSPVPKMETSGH
jgi:outer membrane lipoprotein-sorting protein